MRDSRVALLCSTAAGIVIFVSGPVAASAVHEAASVPTTVAIEQVGGVKSTKQAKDTPDKNLQKKQSTKEKKKKDPDAENGDDNITVIGSLIQQGNVKANAPVQTVDQEYIEDHGLGRLEDTFNQLPGVSPGLGLRGSDSLAGANSVSLRGLSASRTLVTVNGQRAPNDLNAIPSALLQKAEILTGGASTTYGSDAVAGVVNFQLNRKYDKIQFDMETSVLSHRNDNDILLGALARAKYPTPTRNFFGGPQQFVTLTVGKSILNDRVNITGSINYRKTYPIRYSDYDTGGCTLFYNDPNNSTVYRTNSGYFCRTSDYNPYGYFVILPPGGRAYSAYSVSKDGSRTFRPFDPDNDKINHATDGYLQRGDHRVNGSLFVSSDLYKDIKLDGSLFYNRYSTTGHETVTDNYYAINPSTQVFNRQLR